MSQAESIPYAKALGGRDLTRMSGSQQAGQDGEARRKVKGDGRKIRWLKVPKAAIKTRLLFHRR